MSGQPQQPAGDDAVAAFKRQEQARRNDIQDLFALTGGRFPELMAECLDDMDVSAAAAKEKIKAALGKVNGHAAKEELDKTGQLKLTLKSGEVTLLPEDIEVTMAQTEGFMAQRYNGVTVALETTLSEELIEEGFVREIISKLQTMRKENGFEVMDHITVYAAGNDKIVALMQKNEAYIKEITLADAIEYNKTEGFTKDWNLNGEAVTLAVK